MWVNIDTKIKNETGSYMSLTNAAVQDAQGFAGRGESALIHQKQNIQADTPAMNCN